MSQPMVSKALGSDQKKPHYVTVEPVMFPEPILLNLSDKGARAYAKIGIAVQLQRMTEHEKYALAESLGYSEGGGHGASAGPDEAIARLGAHPSLHDATIGVVTRYSSKQLLSAAGRTQMRQELIVAMNRAEDEREGKPRYTVADVLFTEYIIQP